MEKITALYNCTKETIISEFVLSSVDLFRRVLQRFLGVDSWKNIHVLSFLQLYDVDEKRVG